MVKCQSKKQKNNKMNCEMKKRTSGKKIGKKFSIKNKKIIFNLIKVGNELYNIRDKIIDALEKKRNSRATF